MRYSPAATVYNGRTLAKKHFDVEPMLNAEEATATLTVYFSQAELNEYNLADNINGDLPTGPSDILGKTSLRIIQFHGVGTAPGNYPGTEVVIDPDDENIVWNANGNYWEVSFDVTGFSGFYLSSAARAVLPVTLVHFTAQPVNSGHVSLQWKVAQQQGIKSYVVERSATTNNFIAIGSVMANTQHEFTYQWIDEMGLSGKSFYRLKIIDADGSISYSPVVLVSNIKITTSYYPNPVQSLVNISIEATQNETDRLQLINSEGKTITTKKVDLKTGNNNVTWNMAALPAGNYFISSSNGLFPVLKIVKQ
ncbi:MAG: T9SS type A sorting domain-containing protein [Sphingobacteriales bacterium]|nr:MAG: T9SS type A sorting domain-containing protein [Sphingobacteriales bacterium]